MPTEPEFAPDLPLRAELLDAGEEGYRMRLSTERGQAVLLVQRQPDSPVSAATLTAEDRASGTRFWKDIASWLQVDPGPSAKQKPRAVDVAVLSLGALESTDGHAWRALKLVLTDGHDRAEVYLNVAVEPDLGEFVEKDVEHRPALVRLLRATLGDSAAAGRAR